MLYTVRHAASLTLSVAGAVCSWTVSLLPVQQVRLPCNMCARSTCTQVDVQIKIKQGASLAQVTGCTAAICAQHACMSVMYDTGRCKACISMHHHMACTNRLDNKHRCPRHNLQKYACILSSSAHKRTISQLQPQLHCLATRA